MKEFALPIIQALRKLGWVKCDNAQALRDWQPEHDACLLQSLVSTDLLTVAGRRQISRLYENSIELRSGWPCAWKESARTWIGSRLFLSFAGNFFAAHKFATLVSSSIGRHGQRLPEWPRLVDLALQAIARDSLTLLVVSGTTTWKSSLEYAARAGLASLTLECPKHQILEDWLVEALQQATSTEFHASRHQVHISPEAERRNCIDGPLQDRLAISLSDTIYALSVRPKGRIDKLLGARLKDEQFPVGSIFLALPERSSAACQSRTTQEWLDRGAVGWYVPPHLVNSTVHLARCHHHHGQATQQLCSGLPVWWRGDWNRNDITAAYSTAGEEGHASAWPWLAHCTRGTSGPLPDEGEVQFRQRAWLDGHGGESQPLLTLNRILESRRLNGTSRITRTTQRTVSFSAVPLTQLLARRKFQPHLGRWDWEPYGLLIRREALAAIGARPAVYGDASSFLELPAEQRAFFQPLGESQDWSTEEEWRLVGDLDLDVVADDLLVFVKTRSEAQQLCRYIPWPVLWVT